MMKCLLLLWMMIGFCCGLQESLLYKYKYFGTVSTGIPEMSGQQAGWAMKADVVVYMEEDDVTAVFQLFDVKMAEYNVDLGCDVRQDVPEELFHRYEDESLNQALEQPFKVHLFNYEDYAIEHSEDHYKLLVNLRKGIAAIFKNEILKENFVNQVEKTTRGLPSVFSRQEDTMFGKCLTEYEFFLIPEYLSGTKKNELESYVEEDVQLDHADMASGSIKKTSKKTTYKSSKKSSRRKTSKTSQKYTSNVPKLKEDLWHVVRSINFDHCEERVDFQVAPVVGIHGDINAGQHEWIRSRSSVSEYIFRGSPGHMRLESSTVEGATLMAPFGVKTEIIQGRTNQTLHLVSVTTKNSAAIMPSNLQHSKTWMFEIWSFAPPPKISKPHEWITYTATSPESNYFGVLGIKPYSPEKRKEIKTTIIDNVKRVSLYLTDLGQEEKPLMPGKVQEYLTNSVTLFKHMGKADVLQIFDEIFEKDQLHNDVMAKKLIVDVATASGNFFANSAILEYIRKDKLSTLQIMGYFMALTNSAECPSNMPELMNYVLTLDISEKPFLSSTVLVNFADYLNHLCISPGSRTKHFAGAMFGDAGCRKHLIKEKFLPYLKNIIYSKDTTWEKNIALTALRFLGTPLSFPIVVDVIKGKVNCSTKTRAEAVYVLDPYKLHEHSHIREQVIDLLTDVYSDIGEKTEVRQSALESIVFWEPETSFWHRLARATWREPSKNFAVFMSSVIQSFAALDDPKLKIETQAASFALKLAKPVIYSEMYSYFADWTSRKIERHLHKFHSLSWYTSAPPEKHLAFYFDVAHSLGGFEMSFMEIYGSFILAELSFYYTPGVTENYIKIAEAAYDRIEETIQNSKISFGELFQEMIKNISYSDKRLQGELLLKFFDHMSIYLPLRKETIHHLDFGGNVISQLKHGYDAVLGKFLTPINLNSFLPTELGIPMSVSSTMSILASYVSHSNLDNIESRLSSSIKLSAEGLARVSSFGHSCVFAILPWSEKGAITGVTRTTDITVPLNSVIGRETDYLKDSTTTLHLDIQSLYKRKFTFASVINVPYSGFIPILFLNSPGPDVKVIYKTPPKNEKLPLPNAYTGLDFEMNWSSGVSFPFNLWSVIDLIRGEHSGIIIPSSIQFLAASLDFNPETSKTKNISLYFTFGMYGKEREDITQFTQESNGGGQYDQDVQGQYEQEAFDSQQSFDIDQGFQEIGGTDEVETAYHTNFDDSHKQRTEKMQKLFGGSFNVADLKIQFEGTENRSYEIIYSYKISTPKNEREMKKSQLSLIRSPIPHIHDKSASICLDVQKQIPAFSPLDTVDTFLAKNLDKEFKAELTLGCTGESVATLRGTYHLSDEGKLKLRNNAQECNYDRYNPLSSLRSNAIYDDLKYTLTWKQVCDSTNYPFTSKFFGVAEKLMNPGLFSDVCSHHEKERKLEVYAHRCPLSGTWFIDGAREDSKLHLKDIPHNDFLNLFLSIWENRYFLGPDDESDICVLGIDSVRTFDGFTYDYTPTECWTLAVENCVLWEKQMLLIRSPSGESIRPEMKYIDVERGLIIEYSDHEIRVNGKVFVITGDHEVIKNEEGEVIFVIFYKNDFYTIQFLQKYFISIKDKIRIRVLPERRGQMCGLCGNYDGEPESELVGPRRCFYEDSKLFATAWAAESDTCDLYTLLGLRENVEKFQDTCHTIESLHESCPYYNDRCTKFGWMVREMESDLCVSSLPLPYCDEHCDWTESRYEKVDLNCWPAEHVPEVIKNAVKENVVYITTPLHYEPYYHEQVYLSIPTSCKKE